jgi:hypothetical protein
MYRAVVAFDLGILLGIAGLVCSVRMPFFSAHSTSLLLMYFGPLSLRIDRGLPRHSIT